MAIIFVGFPTAILLLIRSDNVRRTLEHYDPTPRWTDAVPMPVLGLSMTLAVVAFLCLIAAVQAVVPLFGTYFTGTAAVAILLVFTALFAWAAWLVHRLRMAGWWLGLLAMLGICLGFVPSALWMPLERYYVDAGMDPMQIEPMLTHESLIRWSMAGGSGLIGVAFAVYMLRIRPKMLKARSASAVA